MYALEEPGTDSAGLTEEEHAQRGARRRRLTHGRSEIRIAEVLETFCEDLDRDDTVVQKPNLGACETLVSNHADAVADHVFAEGTEKHARLPVRTIGKGVPAPSLAPGVLNLRPATRRVGHPPFKKITTARRTNLARPRLATTTSPSPGSRSSFGTHPSRDFAS